MVPSLQNLKRKYQTTIFHYINLNALLEFIRICTANENQMMTLEKYLVLEKLAIGNEPFDELEIREFGFAIA